METIITPQSRYSIAHMFRELWAYRELLIIFARREISIRYKQTAIGILWVILQPLIGAMIFAVIFGVFAKFPSGDVPYVLFAFSSLMFWQYLSRSLTDGSNAFVTHAAMISKVYFPRILLVTTPLVYNGVDFIVSFAALLVLCAVCGYVPHMTVVFLPIILVAGALMAWGVGLCLAPLNAIYRDVSIALPYLIQILMYASPVVFSQEIIPEKYAWVVDVNPVATLMLLFRWALFNQDMPSLFSLIWFTGVTCVLVYVGLRNIRRLQETIVDRI